MPIVAMTALGPRASQERTLEAGFQAHLSKPFTPDRLLKVISSTLRHQQLSEEVEYNEASVFRMTTVTTPPLVSPRSA